MLKFDYSRRHANFSHLALLSEDLNPGPGPGTGPGPGPGAGPQTGFTANCTCGGWMKTPNRSHTHFLKQRSWSQVELSSSRGLEKLGINTRGGAKQRTPSPLPPPGSSHGARDRMPWLGVIGERGRDFQFYSFSGERRENRTCMGLVERDICFRYLFCFCSGTYRSNEVKERKLLFGRPG